MQSRFAILSAVEARLEVTKERQRLAVVSEFYPLQNALAPNYFNISEFGPLTSSHFSNPTTSLRISITDFLFRT
jgi:hypothetical protein